MSKQTESERKQGRERFIEIYSLLIESGLTQTQIADALGVKQPRIAALKAGLSPSIDNLARIVGLAVREGLISAKG
jgi:predicted XRE-type DNA-binding protein